MASRLNGRFASHCVAARQALLAAIALTLGVAGCSSGKQTGLVVVILQGETSAFENRLITINGSALEPPRRSPEATSAHGTEVLIASIGLCTKSREAFLHQPLVISVQTGSETPRVFEIERVGCALNPEVDTAEYNREDNQLWLNADGTIDAEFGSSPDVFASCYRESFELNCEKEALAR